MTTRFYCAACQFGAEKAVKAEVLAEFPRLRFAFSRPGFITFKDSLDSSEALPPMRGVFTRFWAEVLDQAKDYDALASLLRSVPEGAHVQSFDRDECLPGDESPGFTANDHIRRILDTLSPIHPSLRGVALPQVGETVYSLIWVDDFHVFLTKHQHSPRMLPTPGNKHAIVLPESSPSRSYLKIEEAFLRFKPVLERGMRVLEVGCAPGGASSAMLNRGLSVVGIDPQNMDARVASREGFRAVRKQARYLAEDDLLGFNPRYLVMDMSIAPREALSELAHVVSVLRASFGTSLELEKGFLTIKLNDWKFAGEIPAYLKRLEHIGFHDLTPIQLCSNRQEFFVYSGRFS